MECFYGPSVAPSFNATKTVYPGTSSKTPMFTPLFRSSLK